jgi:hypothetical protein
MNSALFSPALHSYPMGAPLSLIMPISKALPISLWGNFATLISCRGCGKLRNGIVKLIAAIYDPRFTNPRKQPLKSLTSEGNFSILHSLLSICEDRFTTGAKSADGAKLSDFPVTTSATSFTTP